MESLALHYFSDSSFFLLQQISLIAVHPWALPAFLLDPQVFPISLHPTFILSSSSSKLPWKLLLRRSGLPEVGLLWDCLPHPETLALSHCLTIWGRTYRNGSWTKRCCGYFVSRIKVSSSINRGVSLFPEKSWKSFSGNGKPMRAMTRYSEGWEGEVVSVYLQEQEEIGRHSSERAIFRRSASRYRVQTWVSIMWP